MKRQKWYTPYLLTLPGVIWVLVFALWPFLNTVALAFTDARPLRPAKFVGLQNFYALFSDERFIYALTTSLVYVIVCVPLLTFLPLLLALLVHNKIPGIGFFRTTFYFPVIASAVVVAIVWEFLFSGNGTINEALKFFGLIDRPIEFLSDRWLLIGCAIGLTVWKGLGYYMVVYLAALGNVGRDLHEAAALDGAGKWRRFWSVTVPGVRGPMLLVSVLICVAAMRIFTELYVLSNGSGGPGGRAMSVVMLIQASGKGLNGQVGYASAISLVLFLLTLIPLLIVGISNNGDMIREALAARRTRKAHKAALKLAKQTAAAPAVNAVKEGISA
ncbi:carbohydrate ABC transporter permease [Arcanobacterium phocae]|uniref:Carbohydrate ABC transporter membrane protein 1, CUT1 family n=1 Tax=Arcanobacterium phocae TaxID=131112 RepID=A0A1H2LB42_9ACTO|nr:sugar ABC transporter permease [Arcanobacterium phocae]SDU78022.1 carbohydrate ABC transporter membrane protein 1, CUT1 family [Arcanobacterium phocae]